MAYQQVRGAAASTFLACHTPVACRLSLFLPSLTPPWAICPAAHRQYNEANQQEAVRWLNQNVHANWGGTEILSVLEAIYKMPLAEGGSRQVSNQSLKMACRGRGVVSRLFPLF